MINFNVPSITGREIDYIQDVINSGHLSGDGKYTKLCHEWLEENTGAKRALLTTSCTHALEMAALLLDIQPGDEVIMPSYTFVSTANAFVLRGAKIVYVDIHRDTMNIDESKIESAITNKTKVIVPVHYAGVPCEMDTIMAIARKYNLYVVEDAAQGVISEYKGRVLGSIGHFGTYSFHETKNITCGEGGALLINSEEFIKRAEIIREKGTNRSQFIRGEIDKYTWYDIGSSYLMSELTAAYLYAQLLNVETITQKRIKIWNLYYKAIQELNLLNDTIELNVPIIPNYVKHNAHIFHFKLPNKLLRDDLIKYLKTKDIQSTFHYIPLHSTEFGKIHGRFHDIDKYTSLESEKLLRLPIYYRLTLEEVQKVITEISTFLKNKVIK